MRSRLFVASLAALFATAVSPAPGLADEGWVINSFHSNIQIAPDSTLGIAEDIRVDFGTQQHHGIFRTIPYLYRYDSKRDRMSTLNISSVTDGSKRLLYNVTDDGAGNVVVRIGDPNVLVAGKQRYVITYTVSGAMNPFSDHDELYWNVDGGSWPVPKQEVTAAVTLPAGSFQKAACYQGPTGSTQACNFAVAPGNVVTYTSTRQLGSGEQMTIVTALNKGAVAVPPLNLVPHQQRSGSSSQNWFVINPFTVGVSALILVIGLGLIVRFWWVRGRDQAYLTQYYLTNDPRERTEPVFKHDPVVVEFEPPQNLRPAELGLILDENADTKDVTATIVDLAVRGVLTINEVQGQNDWLITWRPNQVTNILPFEKMLLDGLFTDGRQQVLLSDLKGSFKPTLDAVEDKMYSDAMSRSFFRTRPDTLRGGRIGCGFMLVLAAFFLGFKFIGPLGGGLTCVALAVVGLATIASYRFMSVRTAAGRDLMQHTLGFRMYMTTAEKYRQQLAEKAEIFTQLLPYAIVFGCVTRWAKAFEGIDTSRTDGWYVGPQPFQAALIASNLQSMNSSISSAISYTPGGSGASGFGGGGGSGGGGGGGGGGGW